MSDRHGGELVADVLVQHGVRTVFTLVGGHVSPILVAARRRGIAVVDVRDEAAAVFAADAVGRLTGVPGVAVVTAGPGVTNAITALKNAQLAQSPLVLIGGATATILKGRGSLQDIDQLALVRPHVSSARTVRRRAELAPALIRAFVEARGGVPGPVFVECPVDLLYPEPTVREWYFAGQAGRPPRDLAERALGWYLRWHLSRLFARGPGHAMAPGSAAPMVPPEMSVRRAARWIGQSQRPVLVVGSQVATGIAELAPTIAAITTLGLPAYLSGTARGLLGPSHPLQFRHHRKAALREADLVVLAGTPCDFRLDYGRHISRRARVISVNRSSRDLTLNRRPTLGCLAAPDLFLRALAVHAPVTERHREAWFDALRSREAAREAEIAEQAATPALPVNPLALCRAIDRHLPDEAIVVADGGDFVATASYVVRPRGPHTWLDPGVFGTLGMGAGFVLGVHAARPGRPIWAIFGDGAFGFSLAEFDTLVRQHVPLVAIIGNDGKWSQIARDQVAILGDDVATSIGRTDYHLAVSGLGAAGLLLDRSDDTDRVLAEAASIAEKGTPVVVNALIGDTQFRKGSMSL
jgi:acetolactate synthase-1/2/3 large subunit